MSGRENGKDDQEDAVKSEETGHSTLWTHSGSAAETTLEGEGFSALFLTQYRHNKKCSEALSL